jgi:hypothetical protein
LFPAKTQDFSDPQSGIQGESSDILNVRSCVNEKFPFLFPGQDTEPEIYFLEKLYFSYRIRAQEKIPINGEVEHSFQKGKFPIYCRAGNFLPSLKFEAFDVGGVNFLDLPFATKEGNQLR